MKCPVCSSKRARVSVSKAGRCCVTCNACHFQGFARSDYSDTLIRQAMTPEAEAKAAEAAAPKPVDPAPGMEIALKPAAPVSEPAPVDEVPRGKDSVTLKRRGDWDLF